MSICQNDDANEDSLLVNDDSNVATKTVQNSIIEEVEMKGI